MTDTVRITRPGAATELNEETGTYEPATITVYEGPARLKLQSSVISETEAVGQLISEQNPRLDLPVETPGTTGKSADVQTDDEAIITDSLHDVANVGLRMTITGGFFQTDATARRLPIEVHS